MDASVSRCHVSELERARKLADEVSGATAKVTVICRGLRDLERMCLDQVRACYSADIYAEVSF